MFVMITLHRSMQHRLRRRHVYANVYATNTTHVVSRLITSQNPRSVLNNTWQWKTLLIPGLMMPVASGVNANGSPLFPYHNHTVIPLASHVDNHG